LGLSKIFARKVHFLLTDSTDTYHNLQSHLNKPSVDKASGDKGGGSGADVDLADTETGGNINMAPLSGADILPDLGQVDVLDAYGRLPFGDDNFVDVNTAANQPSSSSRRRKGEDIPLGRFQAGPVREQAFDEDDDDFDIRSGSKRGGGSVDDVEILRRANATPSGAMRTSLGVGGVLAAGRSGDDDDRFSVVSELDDSVRRGKRGGSNAFAAGEGDSAAQAAAKRKARASLAAADPSAMADDEDLYDLSGAMGLDDVVSARGGAAAGGLDQQDGIDNHDFDDNANYDAAEEAPINDAENVNTFADDLADVGKGAVKKTKILPRLGLADDAELFASRDVDAKSAKEKSAAAQRRRKELLVKKKVLRADDETIVSSETMKSWLKDTSAITKPRYRGAALLAHLHSTSETARNERLVHEKDFPISESGAVFAAAAALTSALDSMAFSSSSWALAFQSSSSSSPLPLADAKTEAAASRIALIAGSNSAAAAATRSRQMIGPALGGIGDLTEDGDLSIPIPAVVNADAELSKTNFYAGALLAQPLSSVIYLHGHGRGAYPSLHSSSSSSAANDEAADEEEEFEANAGENGHAANPIKADFAFDNADYDADIAGDGIGADGAVTGDSLEWKEDASPVFSKKASLDGSVSSLSAKLGAVAASAASISPLDSARSGAGMGMEGTNEMVGENEDEELESNASSSMQQRVLTVDGISSSEVDKDKWHPATIAVLRALAAVMTGPVPQAAPAGGRAAGKKRKASELLAAAPGSLAKANEGGDLGDVTKGKGTPSDPVSFKELSAGISRRIAASSFFQLLVLKSWDIIDVKQEEPYGDLMIARTSRFSTSLVGHAE
jgi:hypothetical protein